MIHPGKELIEELRIKNLTQKDFSLMLGKRVSELNELIKGKRNITIQRDILLSQALGTPEKYWIHKQIDYDYHIIKKELGIDTETTKNIVDESNPVVESEDNLNQDISTNLESKQDFQENNIEELDSHSNMDSFENNNIREESSDDIDFEKRKRLQDIFIKF